MRELIQIFEHQANAYLPPDSGNAEYRFEMGELPAEMVEICARLFKLTDGLRGLAEFILNDLTEQTASTTLCGLHRTIIQMSRTLGYLEAMSKLWRLAAMDKSSNAADLQMDCA
ncbi:ATP-dependent DNA helicase DinG [Serratia fonticola]|uniref:ATP-dependent DNA helicase DinG n=1 Tax=Serratia fonticola TaxID=47917 RepID=A0A4V6KVP3_SERFO|nr:ATP-dependent DNA helicase DinG [Serratia fonticola]